MQREKKKTRERERQMKLREKAKDAKDSEMLSGLVLSERNSSERQ